VKDADGKVVEVRCTYDPATRGGDAPDGRKVKGTIHWVSEPHAGDVEVRLVDRLFLKEDLNDLAEGEDWRAHLNPDSLRVARAKVEPTLLTLAPGAAVQFERVGYFVADTKDSSPGNPVFNRTVTLKDSWAKAAAKA
jgi:glutaminyl-tRNA synthetase